MSKYELILLKMLLLSTSASNIRKYSNDSKKKKRAIGTIAGQWIVIIMLMIYAGLVSVAFGVMGMADAIPGMCAAIVSLISFFFTVFKVNGYIFAFKEYDMLMSLPFEVKSVVKAKFLYMYLKSIIWYMAISIACLIGYAFFALPTIVVYPLWIILSFLLPIFSMILATAVGFIISKIGSGFKAAKLMQTILSFAFILLAFCSRFVIESMFKDGKASDSLASISDKIDSISCIYLPIKWFDNAICKLSIVDILLFVCAAVLLVELVMRLVAASYRKINSSLMTNSFHKNYTMRNQKVRSAVNAIAFKEFRRMTGTNVYMVNIFMGEVFATIIGILSLIIGVDRIVAIATNNAPIPEGILMPAIPFIIYFFIGMVPSTVCSPSLEGRNYWIVQSLPIDKKTLYRGKLLFNMYLTVPFTLFAVLCLCISARTSIVDMILYLITGIVLCAFSSSFGLLCGRKFMRLDWENEVEVVKQGTAATVYIFPNMILTIALCVGTVFLGFVISTKLISLIVIAIYAILSVILYKISINMKN